jgi:hypothetical protein
LLDAELDPPDAELVSLPLEEPPAVACEPVEDWLDAEVLACDGLAPDDTLDSDAPTLAVAPEPQPAMTESKSISPPNVSHGRHGNLMLGTYPDFARHARSEVARGSARPHRSAMRWASR